LIWRLVIDSDESIIQAVAGPQTVFLWLLHGMHCEGFSAKRNGWIAEQTPGGGMLADAADVAFVAFTVTETF
jgi:hypothetical protein